MAVAPSMRRLLRVLTLEEEQAQAALESALGQLRQLQNALNSAMERERVGRQLLGLSAQSGEVVDRLAALEEIAAARRTAAVLLPRLMHAEQEAELRREKFLVKRVERRQVETLIHEAEKCEAVEVTRRSQQSMNDGYLVRFIQRDSTKDDVACELGDDAS